MRFTVGSPMKTNKNSFIIGRLSYGVILLLLIILWILYITQSLLEHQLASCDSLEDNLDLSKSYCQFAKTLKDPFILDKAHIRIYLKQISLCRKLSLSDRDMEYYYYRFTDNTKDRGNRQIISWLAHSIGKNRFVYLNKIAEIIAQDLTVIYLYQIGTLKCNVKKV
jgi:hypothetical protein